MDCCKTDQREKNGQRMISFVFPPKLIIYVVLVLATNGVMKLFVDSDNMIVSAVLATSVL